jgi:hypothetical protein
VEFLLQRSSMCTSFLQMCYQVSPAISSLPYPLYFNTNFDINIPSSKENCKYFYLSCVLHTPPIPIEVLPFSISALISVYKHDYKATCWLFKIEVKLTPQSTVHLGVVVSYRCHYLTNTKVIRKVNTVYEYFRRSVEVVILLLRAVFPHSLASHRR